MNYFEKRLDSALSRQKEKGLWRSLEATSSPRIDLSSNDYLQLKMDPAVIYGAELAQREFGTGSGASPLISGFLPCHQNLMNRLKKWKNKKQGLLYNSGFITNQAIFKHLPGPKDLVLADRLIHHSMIQPISQSKAKFKRYRHLDMEHLEELLKRHSNEFETIFVVTESVFSMDGDYPDLKRLVQIKNNYPFCLVLDEAHAIGCYGPSGGGLAEEEGVLESVDIIIGTLGKALANMGGYLLTQSPMIVEYLTNFSGELIYSTFLPPAAAGGSLAALDIIQKASIERERLKKIAITFRKNLREMGSKTNAFDSQIVPIFIGNNEDAIELKNRFHKKGILVGVARPPTVPNGTARLRVSLHSRLAEEHLQEFLAILKSC